MPTYNYECKACKNRLTVFQSMNDSPLQDCDKCGGKGTLNRIITGGTGKYAGITGSGPWKCTDVGKAGENFCNQSLTYQLP